MESNATLLCQDCKYFYQHYGKDSHGKFIVIYAGHCSRPRLKNRKPDHPICQHFAQKSN